jgi:hypothetical protein
MTIHPFLFVGAILLNLAVGVGFGIMYERFGWNELIRRGVLPKPRGAQ